jgi:CRISPR-associated protein Cas2
LQTAESRQKHQFFLLYSVAWQKCVVEFRIVQLAGLRKPCLTCSALSIFSYKQNPIMPRGEMLTVFTYDVSEGKRRRRNARLLEDASTRVQKSVFEARMTHARADAISQRIAAMLGDGDSLRVYAIGADGLSRSRTFGDGAPFETAEGFWLV